MRNVFQFDELSTSDPFPNASTHLDDTSGVVCVDISAICCLCLEWQRSTG